MKAIGTSMGMRVLGLCTCAAGMLFLSGCLISGSSHESLTGRRISETSLSQIEVGRTTSGWVEAAFGAPTSRQIIRTTDVAVAEAGASHQTELWRYEWRWSVDSSGTIFLLLDSHNEKVDSTTVFLEFTDGIVTRYWKETSG